MRHGFIQASAVLAASAAFWPLAALAQQPSTLVEGVTVNGVLPSIDDTYRTPDVTVGPLGDKALLDTPYSITVVPVQLAENQQLESVRELFRYIPSVQGENIRPQSRGFQAGVVQNTRIDGLNIAATTDYAIEQFEQVEVLNGLSGALYGPASPAGTFNYVFKRPTQTPLTAVTVGYATQQSLIEHADISRRFGPDDMFGARLNLLNQAGENYVDDSGLKRRLASLALDAHILPSTVLQFDLSTYRYIDTGFPGTFSLAQGVPFPSTPNPTREGYGQSWAGDNNETHIFSGRILQDFGDDWRLTGGLLYMTNDRASTAPTDTITSTGGAYTATTVNTTYSLDRVLSNTAALNGKVFIAGLKNDIFLGTTGFFWQRYTPYQTGAITLGQSSLSDPDAFDEPVLPNFQNRYRSLVTDQQSFNFGDTIAFGQYFSVMAAASQSWIAARNVSKTGAITSRYNADGLSPTGSLIFKPRANMTAYVTYADSLQQGDIAPAGTLNVGQSLAPYRSKQWEAGYKIDLQHVNLALALYQIERPYAYTGANKIYALQGEQRNRGLELTANGRLTRDINVFAGLSLIDPKLLNTGSAATSNKQILGVANTTMDVLLEYNVPMMRRLTLSTNVNYMSRRPGNYTNTDFVDSYTVVDLNARYQMHVDGRPVALRIAADNVGGERYWANISPVGQNGYTGSDSGTGTLGAPRTLRVSLEIGL